MKHRSGETWPTHTAKARRQRRQRAREGRTPTNPRPGVRRAV